MTVAGLHAFAPDIAGLLFHVLAFVGYRAFHSARGRRDPRATLQSQQAAIRALWVADIQATKNGILGVQTIRNAMMAALFFASNTMFLVIGSLTLMAQEHLGEVWALLDLQGVQPAPLAQAKVLLLLLTLLVAFFCFTSAVRLLAHVSISIGTSKVDAQHVVVQLDKAWAYQGLGVRCYYFGAPVLCWVFGVQWLVLASIGALLLMHAFDSARS
jgi:uncharacterized membrane protein